MPQEPTRRRGLALTLVILASVIAFIAILSIWVNRQLLNTDNWATTSGRLLEQPTVRNEVSGYLVDQLYANVDVEAKLREALPPQVQALAGPAAGALRNVAERAALEALSRPRVQLAWEEANRRAHRRLLQVLEGGGPNVSTANGVVTLDLKQLLT